MSGTGGGCRGVNEVVSERVFTGRIDRNRASAIKFAYVRSPGRSSHHSAPDRSNSRHQPQLVANQRQVKRGPIQQSARCRQGNEAKEFFIADCDLFFSAPGYGGSPSARAVEEVWSQRYCLS